MSDERIGETVLQDLFDSAKERLGVVLEELVDIYVEVQDDDDWPKVLDTEGMANLDEAMTNIEWAMGRLEEV